MKCVTGPLTPAQLLGEIPEIVRLLETCGIENLVVEYGPGCKLEAGEMWKQVEIRSLDVVAFIQDSVDKGIFLPGQADLMLQDRDGNFECLLCRDSDIHLTTEDDGLIVEATRRWMDKGYGGFRMATGEDWQPI